MKIRRAVPEDSPHIARVHVDTWRSNYRGIVPDSFLDGLTYGSRQAMWRRVLSAEHDSFVFVGEDEQGNIVGFASGGPTRSPELPYKGELYAIYVLRSHQGMGFGKALARAVAAELAARGMESMLLWVLAANDEAMAFYEAIGGQPVREQEFELGGATLLERGYGWADTAALRA